MLSELSLTSCSLEGEIPEWISTQKTVNFLDLSKNELQGSFPQWLAEIKVEYMILSDNKLSGSLPPALFQSSRLFVLALSRNNFSGELPYNIGDAKTLYILMLDRNNFSGPIPQSISQNSNLLTLKYCCRASISLLTDSQERFQPPFLNTLKFLHWEETSFLGPCLWTWLSWEIFNVSNSRTTTFQVNYQTSSSISPIYKFWSWGTTPFKV